METAKACGLEAYQYLRLLFEKIPHAQTEQDYKSLLPRNLTPEHLSDFMAYV
ncbi:MAG: transposase domain-containing protein [Syntrophobacteraceae bacterium]